jgi:hypothetical protein
MDPDNRQSFPGKLWFDNSISSFRVDYYNSLWCDSLIPGSVNCRLVISNDKPYWMDP